MIEDPPDSGLYDVPPSSYVLVSAGGCSWYMDESCLPALPDPSSEEYQAAALSMEAAKIMAVQVLWALSGRQFCLLETTIRPCPEKYPAGLGRVTSPSSYEIFSWNDYGGWATVGCGCGARCIRTGPGMVHLPGPVGEVLEVVINGETVADTEYVLEGNVLYRTGAAWWPSQDMTRPATEPGTWKVTYTRGLAPPPETAKLVGLLATEFYTACTGGKCRLPRTVTELSRQGVTHRIVNPNDIYSTGKTGIPEIDLWLSAVNPHHILSAPVVL